MKIGYSVILAVMATTSGSFAFCPQQTNTNTRISSELYVRRQLDEERNGERGGGWISPATAAAITGWTLATQVAFAAISPIPTISTLDQQFASGSGGKWKFYVSQERF